MVTSRIDSLQLDEISILKAASVLGNQIELPVLRRLILEELRDPQFDSTLSALGQYELLIKSDSGEQGYKFRHDIIRRVVYDQLTSSQREKLHRDTAHAIESIHSNQLETQFAILAHHWSMARVPIATVNSGGTLAAKQALASGAYTEADRLLQHLP